MSKKSNCYVGTQSEEKNIGARNCAGLIPHLLVPRSSSKPCAKKKLPPILSAIFTAWSTISMKGFAVNLFQGLVFRRAERILIESYHIVLYFEAISMPKNYSIPYAGTGFTIYSNSDNYHSESLSTACQFSNCLLESTHFSCSPSTIPLLSHMVVLSILPMHLRQFLLPHLRFHLL